MDSKYTQGALKVAANFFKYTIGLPYMFVFQFFREPETGPIIPGLRLAKDETIPYEDKIYGHVVFGKPKSGKTRSEARQFASEAVSHWDDIFISLDASGSFTDDVLGILSLHPNWEDIIKRIVYIRLADPEWVVPTPEFSTHYGTTYEEQVSRVLDNWEKLGELERFGGNVVKPSAFKVVLPNALRLAVAMAHVTEHHEPFQIPEVHLMLNYPHYINSALNKVGDALNPFVRDDISKHITKASDLEVRVLPLSGIFSALGSPYARADLGHYRPGWRMQDSLIFLIDGSLALNQQGFMEYKMLQIFSIIMESVNRRRPHDPGNTRINIYVDETPAITKLYADDIVRDLLSRYRSRNVAFTSMYQTYNQLSEELQKDIFLSQSVTVYGQAVKPDTDDLAYQLNLYDPYSVKNVTSSGSTTYESERGLDRLVTDWLMNLPDRACLIKRRSEDGTSFLVYVAKTKEVPPLPSPERLEEIKQELLELRGERIRDALKYHQERIDWLSGPPARPTILPTSGN